MNALNHNIIKNFYKIFLKQKNQHYAQSYTNWETAKKLGFPNKNHEDWKNVCFDNFLKSNFTISNRYDISYRIFKEIILSLDAYKIVFVNGYFMSHLSDLNTGSWNIKIEYGKDRKPLLDPIKSEFFLHLSESLSKQTTKIYLSEFSKEKKPLYIININCNEIYSKKKKSVSIMQYRNHIDIDSNSYGQIIEHNLGLSSNPYFSNTRTTISIKKNSKLIYNKLLLDNRNSYHFGYDDIYVDSNVNLINNLFIIGSKLNFNKSNFKICGSDSALSLNSLSSSSKNNISILNTYMEHNQKNCFSNQLHKNIAYSNGKCLFNGLIKVNKNSDRTNSNMINKNLLLHEKSSIYSNPQLEIYNDNVKCSHGTTFSNIDEKQIFYLRSRGINYYCALEIIKQAFSQDIISKLDNYIIEKFISYNINKYL